MTKLLENVLSSVNEGVQWGGVAALTGNQDCVEEMKCQYRRRRELIVKGLNNIEKISCLWPKGRILCICQYFRDWTEIPGVCDAAAAGATCGCRARHRLWPRRRGIYPPVLRHQREKHPGGVAANGGFCKGPLSPQKLGEIYALHFRKEGLSVFLIRKVENCS